MPDDNNYNEDRYNGKPNDIVENRIDLNRAQILLNVSQTMAAHETLDEMLEALIDIITSEVDAERGTIFLIDTETDELYSRVTRGGYQREIRIREKSGVAGYVFKTGEGVIVDNAYADKRFDRSVDEKTGFVTRNILCAPIRTVKHEIIGVAQVLNKRKGNFTAEDLHLLDSMTTQAAVALQTTAFIEKIKKTRQQEMEFFDVVSEVISEIDLGRILQKVMSQATKMLNAERSTLFINDEKTNHLFSQVGEGLGALQIRIPNHKGIAGTVFTSGKSVNIPYAYADLRFSPETDKRTGFFTRSILCVPVVNKKGKTIGVTQVLNKRGGPFTDEDEFRLRAFTNQISMALENAKLFNDVQNMKNYSEGILESMSSGVITLNEDRVINTCNAAGLRILKMPAESIIDQKADEFFTEPNSWITDKIQLVQSTREEDQTMDREIILNGDKISVNLTVLPFTQTEAEGEKIGSIIIIEDISENKRVKSTMSRYIDPSIVSKLLESDEDLNKSTVATVLFSDIRSFTTLTEKLGAEGTVSLLNEYFEIMVECIQREKGMLDKFIGDAIMAGFGVPVSYGDDEDRALRAAISMIATLNEWNLKRKAHGKRLVDMGIGLSTDNIVVGNIGSPKQMNYTMIGDGVNLASRLETACKQYFTKILISENTFKKLRGTYRVREIDSVIVKGKTKPVSIYEVLDYHTNDSFPNLMEVVSYFNSGVELYRRREWDKAVSSFEKALKLNPKDRLSRMYIERCVHYKENPPDDKWVGVWIMTEK